MSEEITENAKINGCIVFDYFKKRTETRDYEPIETGIKEIDNALGGGLTRGTFITLGAAPGAGKTAFCQWLFEGMAAAGHEVLYINLEMSPDQLIARSLQRHVWEKNKRSVSALKILRGYSWSRTEKPLIESAMQEYRQNIAPNMFYMPVGEGELIQSNKISDIEAAIIEICEARKAEGKEAPLICLDYLHLIDCENKDLAESLKAAMLKLKREIALKYNTIVLCVIANNRDSNKKGVAELESGRDTSAIEYSADIAMGIVYTAIEDGRLYDSKNPYDMSVIKKYRRAYYDPDYADKIRKDFKDAGTAKPHEEITLLINKNRFGAYGGVELIFNERNLCFKSAKSAEGEFEKSSNLPF